jgi:hypothetical protein
MYKKNIFIFVTNNMDILNFKSLQSSDEFRKILISENIINLFSNQISLQ